MYTFHHNSKAKVKVALFLLFILLGPSTAIAQQDAPENVKPMTLSELSDERSKNRERFNRNYYDGKGKYVVLSGYCGKIHSRGRNNQLYGFNLISDPRSVSGGVECSVLNPADFEDELLNLDRGQQLTVRGILRLTGRDDGFGLGPSLFIRDCVVDWPKKEEK